MFVDGQMLQKILSDLIKVKGINAAFIIGIDGFVIEHISNVKVDTDALGAMASTSANASIKIGRELGKGNCEQILVELEHGPIMISSVSQNEILAVVADKSANLGRIRHELKMYKDRIAVAL